MLNPLLHQSCRVGVTHWMLLILLFSSSAASAAPYQIVMILWRGETDVEVGFRDYVLEHGLPFTFQTHDLNGDLKKLPDLVAQIRQQKPDLIYTWGTPITLALVGEYDKVDPSRHITDIPVFFTPVAFPLESRLVPSMASSGRNITGTTHMVPLESQIKAIRAYHPLTRLAILYNPAEPNSVSSVQQLHHLANTLDFEVLDQAVPLDDQNKPTPETLPELVAQLAAREPQFLYLGPDTFIGNHRQIITKVALQHRLPVFAATERNLESQALLGLVTRYRNLGRFSAFKVRQILVDKIPPRDIPIEGLRRFSYVINMTVAKQLALYPPLTVLNYAEVITEPQNTTATDRLLLAPRLVPTHSPSGD